MSKSKVFGIAALVLVGLFLVGAGEAAFGPDWVVDSVQGHTVSCHERWHLANVRTVTVPVFTADGLKAGAACPNS